VFNSHKAPGIHWIQSGPLDESRLSTSAHFEVSALRNGPLSVIAQAACFHSHKVSSRSSAGKVLAA
jgi:hypothetical protein